MTEADIIHERGEYWVARDRAAYTVCRNTSTHAVSIQSFAKDADGLSVAIAYCDYLARRKA